MERVVDVDDEDLRGPLQPRMAIENMALEDEHVAPRFELVELGVADVAYRKVGVGEAAQRGRHKLDIVFACERDGHVPGPDRWARHPALEDVGSDDRDPVPLSEDSIEAERGADVRIRLFLAGLSAQR